MWQWYALVGMGCFAAMQLTFRYLGRKGVDSPGVLLIVFAVGALLYLLHIRVTRTPIPTTLPVVGLLVLAGILSYIGNLFSVRAVTEAPNPGYALALVSLQGAVVTLIAVGIFGAPLSWVKMLGVVLCCAGVALLVV